MECRIPFSGRSIRYTEEEVAVVAECMRSAVPLTQGRYLHEFEQKFASYQGVEEGSCFAVCNGTCALELAAALCGIRPGDEVIVPSHTFTSSAYPFQKAGAKIVWCDVAEDTHVVDAATIARVMTPKTKAVVAVHLYGYMADMPSIVNLCHEKNVLVIEDAAQAIGCEFHGRKAGSFGDMAAFSFHSHKNLTTLGEGGMIYVQDKLKRQIVPMLRHNGHCAFPYERKDYWKPAMGNVDLPMVDGRAAWPANYCLGEAECALGAKLLDRIDSINDAKRQRALSFIDGLSDCPELVFLREETRRHNYHLLVAAMTKGTEARDKFMRIMYREHGIQCAVQYMPLNRYDYYARLGLSEASCPAGDRFFDTMISFPFHASLSDEDVAYMAERTKQTLLEL